MRCAPQTSVDKGLTTHDVSRIVKQWACEKIRETIPAIDETVNHVRELNGKHGCDLANAIRGLSTETARTLKEKVQEIQHNKAKDFRQRIRGLRLCLTPEFRYWFDLNLDRWAEPCCDSEGHPSDCEDCCNACDCCADCCERGRIYQVITGERLDLRVKAPPVQGSCLALSAVAKKAENCWSQLDKDVGAEVDKIVAKEKEKKEKKDKEEREKKAKEKKDKED